MGLSLDEFTVQFVAFVIKFSIILGLCLQIPPLMVWVERRAPALMQRRKGPNRVGLFGFRLFGLVQSAVDAIKLIFKEEVVPDGANKFFFHAAPVFAMFPAILVATAIPYGPSIHVFGYLVPLSITSLDVGFLFIFAIASIAVYGVALAGWSCNNKYSLLGSLRASAQMISYEIPLGMSLIPAVLIYDTLDLNTIVLKQSNIWGVVWMPVSFFIFLICMFAETNRAPFDLAEGESELVAGFHTEYGSFKFSQFYLAEYVSMFVLSCLASTIFFGGWQIPFLPFGPVVELLSSYGVPFAEYLMAALCFGMLLIKACFFMWVYVWVRWTLPRFRYDQLMNLGWKFMLPVALANIVVTAGVLQIVRVMSAATH